MAFDLLSTLTAPVSAERYRKIREGRIRYWVDKGEFVYTDGVMVFVDKDTGEEFGIHRIVGTWWFERKYDDFLQDATMLKQPEFGWRFPDIHSPLGRVSGNHPLNLVSIGEKVEGEFIKDEREPDDTDKVEPCYGWVRLSSQKRK